jgi:hypothetical protein
MGYFFAFFIFFGIPQIFKYLFINALKISLKEISRNLSPCWEDIGKKIFQNTSILPDEH